MSCRLRIHHRLHHPLIVKMLDVFISDDNYLNIVLEYVKNGALFNLINSTTAPNEPLVRWVYHEAAAAQLVLCISLQQYLYSW
jgi:serine/threonine protein kinase